MRARIPCIHDLSSMLNTLNLFASLVLAQSLIFPSSVVRWTQCRSIIVFCRSGYRKATGAGVQTPPLFAPGIGGFFCHEKRAR